MRVRIRRFRDLSLERPEVGATFRHVGFTAPRFLSGFTLSAPWQAQPKLIGWRMTIHDSYLLLTIAVRAFTTRVANTPSADFCCQIDVPCGASSHEIRDTQQISRGKFDGLPRTDADLQPATLMDMGFAVIGPLARCRMPAIGFLFIASRFCPRFFQTPPYDDALLRFASTSPPSGCEEDFHLRAVEHARHTK